jgi:hypothetical protein
MFLHLSCEERGTDEEARRGSATAAIDAKTRGGVSFGVWDTNPCTAHLQVHVRAIAEDRSEHSVFLDEAPLAGSIPVETRAK